MDYKELYDLMSVPLDSLPAISAKRHNMVRGEKTKYAIRLSSNKNGRANPAGVVMFSADFMRKAGLKVGDRVQPFGPDKLGRVALVKNANGFALSALNTSKLERGSALGTEVSACIKSDRLTFAASLVKPLLIAEEHCPIHQDGSIRFFCRP